MRAPFPKLREQSISSNSGSKKKNSSGTEPNVPSSELDVGAKKEKKEKPNAFLELFKPRDQKKK